MSGAVAALPRALRAQAGAQLQSGYAARLAAALAGWARGAELDHARFAARYFGRAADDKLAATLHAAALHIARATDHGDLRTASEQLASAIQLVGIDGWPRFVAAAQAHAEMQPPLLVATPIPLASASPVVLARAPSRSSAAPPHPAPPPAHKPEPHAPAALHGTAPNGPPHGNAHHGSAHAGGAAPAGKGAHGHNPAHGDAGKGKPPAPATPAENEEALARIIQSESGGVPAAKTAVGWAVRNRMLRNGKADVRDVQSGFAHGTAPKPEDRTIARGILDGSIPDPTQGATHFYSPQIMQREGEPPKGQDISGGLEAVPGILDDNKKEIQTYRPGFAVDGHFEPIPMRRIPEAMFKFFREKGNGHVR